MQRALLSGLIAAAIPLCLAAYQLSPSAFHISIIDGEGAMNNIQGRVAQEPIIQVTDENHKPVKGAYVTFSSPNSGPGVTFSNGSTQFSTTTDDLGHAVAHGLKPNGQSGSFNIQVHVTYNGQPVGDTTIHESNVAGTMAALSLSLENGGGDDGVPSGALGAGVVGVVTGPKFDLNGSEVPDNANLMAGSEVVALDKTVRIFLQGHCDFLLAPNSAVHVENGSLILDRGKVRARHCGTCKVVASHYVVTGNPDADGVIAYSGGNLQVGSVTGTLQVASNQGTVAGTVAPGAYSTFGPETTVAGAGQAGQTGAAGGASGATTGAAPASTRSVVIYGTTLGVVLAGLGLAVDAILQPAGGGVPTSPP